MGGTQKSQTSNQSLVFLVTPIHSGVIQDPIQNYVNRTKDTLNTLITQNFYKVCTALCEE